MELFMGFQLSFRGFREGFKNIVVMFHEIFKGGRASGKFYSVLRRVSRGGVSGFFRTYT